MNWLTQYLIDKAIKENPEKVIKMLIKKYLPGRHLSTNPNQKRKAGEWPRNDIRREYGKRYCCIRCFKALDTCTG